MAKLKVMHSHPGGMELLLMIQKKHGGELVGETDVRWPELYIKDVATIRVSLFHVAVFSKSRTSSFRMPEMRGEAILYIEALIAGAPS